MAASYSTGPAREPGTAFFDAVVLAGGAGRRLGGVDKAALQVGGRSLLARVLAAVADADRIVVVGPRRDVPVDRTVGWTREWPPGSGPLAGLAAGVRALVSGTEPSHEPISPIRGMVVVCAIDLPWLDTSTVRRLTATLGEHPEVDAAMLVDADGRQQPLAACYRADALGAALRAIGDPSDRPVRLLFDHLDVLAVPATRQARDIDTPDDLEVAMLDDWARRLAEELGVGDELADLELDPILNLARDAAHTIERPAAPVTTFLAGYAAARRAAGSSEVSACIEQASRFTLAAGESERPDDTNQPGDASQPGNANPNSEKE